MRMREMRFHVGYAHIYKANKRIIAYADDVHRQKLLHGHPTLREVVVVLIANITLRRGVI